MGDLRHYLTLEEVRAAVADVTVDPLKLVRRIKVHADDHEAIARLAREYKELSEDRGTPSSLCTIEVDVHWAVPRGRFFCMDRHGNVILPGEL